MFQRNISTISSKLSKLASKLVKSIIFLVISELFVNSCNLVSNSSELIFSLLSIIIEISVNFSHKPKAEINPLIIFLLLIFILIFKSRLNALKISK
jgi:hypothetical protein